MTSFDVDSAFETFESIVDAYKALELTGPESESEARMRLIDRILFECLGWPRSAPLEETGKGSGEGSRIDYVLIDGDGNNWAVVEAKKPDELMAKEEGSGKDGSRGFKLSGPVFNWKQGESWKGAWEVFRDQVARYAVEHGTSVGIATNGHQWAGAVVPSRSGKKLEEDTAVVFASLDAIKGNFERFYNYFSLEGVKSRYLERFLLGGKNGALIECERPFYIVRPEEVRPISYEPTNREFRQPIQEALDRAFGPIEDDPEIIERCFVPTEFSADADDRLARLTERLAEYIDPEATRSYEQDIRTKGTRVKNKSTDLLAGRGSLTLLTGELSAGKTTYIKRFFKYQLTGQLRQNSILYAHIEFDRKGGNSLNPQDIHRLIVEALEESIFGDKGQNQGQFFNLFSKEWEVHQNLFGNDSAQKTIFIQEQMEKKRRQPLEHAERLLRLSVHGHSKLPCLVLDGLDSLSSDLQDAILQAATTLFRNCFGVISVLLDDSTIWRLHAREVSELFFQYVTLKLWLPRPKIGDVIDRRFEYLKQVFEENQAEGEEASTNIGDSSMRWKFDPDKVTAYLRDSILFPPDENTHKDIAKLANYNVREVLSICRTVLLSPALEAEKVFVSLLSAEETKVLERRTLLKILIRPHNTRFRQRPNHFVYNVLDSHFSQNYAPMLPAMMLAQLDRKRRLDESSKEEIKGFVPVSILIELFDRILRIPEFYTRKCLNELFQGSMIEAYDPSAKDVSHISCEIKIKPRGELHLRWLKSLTYVEEIAATQPICDRELGFELKGIWDQLQVFQKDRAKYDDLVNQFTSKFIGYLLSPYQELPLSTSQDLAAASALYTELKQYWKAKVSQEPFVTT